MPSARQPFVVGNWKMNGRAADLAELSTMAAAVADGAAGRAACAICPPATLIDRAVAVAAGRLAIGGQDCAVGRSGPHTGDVSAVMLHDAGATLVIVGHSERRADHGEDNGLVRAKTEAAWAAGLLAIVCVGESEAERLAGQAHDVVASQLAGSVPAGASAETLVIAYEPVWAVGTGRTPTEADIGAMHGFVRGRLAEMVGADTAAATRILYGGSVKPANAGALMAVPDVDGALIGGASLKAADFMAIAAAYR